MKTLSISAIEELKSLCESGFTVTVTQATDGSDIILAKNSEGLTRIFTFRSEE